MKKTGLSLLWFITVLVVSFSLSGMQVVLAEDKEVPPGVSKQDKTPGKGKHKGWEKGKHKGWTKQKEKKETKEQEKKESKGTEKENEKAKENKEKGPSNVEKPHTGSEHMGGHGHSHGK